MEKSNSFVRFYAIREMRARPRTFLPLVAIFFGVILLVGNLLIWFQCQLTTDVAYYRVKAQLILPDILEEELPVLESLPWVNEVEAVPGGMGYTCYVDLTEDVVGRYRKVQDSLYNTIDRMNLEDRSIEYVRFWTNIHNEETHNDAYNRTKLVNYMYLNALQESMFNPGTMTLAAMAMAMLFAVTVLVYRMKLSQGSKEYACLTGMGLTNRDLAKIQTWQGWVILTVTYIPATLIAMGTMWMVSEVSKGIYPDFNGNQAMLYAVPWMTMGILYFLYLAAVWLGIRVCLRPFRKKSVTAILAGQVDKLPFIEKSSVKFLSEGSFDGYGKLWKKRNRRSIVPVMGLFGALILLPAFIFGGFIDSAENLFEKEPEGVQIVCSLSPGAAIDGTYGVPYPLVRNLSELPVVAEVSYDITYGAYPKTPAPGIAMPQDNAIAYMKVGNKEAKVWVLAPLETDGADAAYMGLTPDEIVVGEDFPGNVGDTVTLTWGGRTESARIGKKLPEMNGFVTAWDTSKTILQAAVSIDLYKSFMGDETLYLMSSAYISADVTPETVEDVLDEIAWAMGNTRLYLNDFDQRLHGSLEKGYTVHNRYYNVRIGNIQGAFLSLFFLTQSVYLMLCAAAVIGTTVGFQLRRRKGEFAVLRALGLPEEALYKIGQAYAGVLFRWVVPILYPILVLAYWYSYENAGLQKDDFGNTYIGALGALKTAIWTYAITAVILFLLYAGISHLASRRAVRDMVEVPLALAVKERE